MLANKDDNSFWIIERIEEYRNEKAKISRDLTQKFLLLAIKTSPDVL